MNVEDLRPIEHEHPTPIESSAATAGLIFAGVVIAVVLGGAIAAAIAVTVATAILVRRVWLRLRMPLPRAIDLTTEDPLEAPISALVDKLVASALDADADSIRFRDHAGGVAVFFDRPAGLRRALVVPFELAFLLVDELTTRAGSSGELTTTVGDRPVHLTIRLAPGDELVAIDLVRLWS